LSNGIALFAPTDCNTLCGVHHFQSLGKPLRPRILLRSENLRLVLALPLNRLAGNYGDYFNRLLMEAIFYFEGLQMVIKTKKPRGLLKNMRFFRIIVLQV